MKIHEFRIHSSSVFSTWGRVENTGPKSKTGFEMRLNVRTSIETWKMGTLHFWLGIRIYLILVNSYVNLLELNLYFISMKTFLLSQIRSIMELPSFLIGLEYFLKYNPTDRKRIFPGLNNRSTWFVTQTWPAWRFQVLRYFKHFIFITFKTVSNKLWEIFSRSRWPLVRICPMQAWFNT